MKVTINFHFYRAPLCISAIFAGALRLSVRLSVTLMHSIQTAEDIVKLLCRPGSPIILVFESPCRYPIPRDTPSAGGTKYKGWENFAIFN